MNFRIIVLVAALLLLAGAGVGWALTGDDSGPASDTEQTDPVPAGTCLAETPDCENNPGVEPSDDEGPSSFVPAPGHAGEVDEMIVLDQSDQSTSSFVPAPGHAGEVDEMIVLDQGDTTSEPPSIEPELIVPELRPTP